MKCLKALTGILLLWVAQPAFAQDEKHNDACSDAFPKGKERYPKHGVGLATMLADGTICVLYKPFIDEEGGDERPSPMLVVYSPKLASYLAVHHEIGRLGPGQIKMLRDFLNTYPDKR